MRSFARKPALMAAAMAATASVAAGAAVVETTASAAPVAPSVTTNAATAVSPTSETLLGTVNPNGTATGYHFDYGTTTAYGGSTPSEPVGTGTTPAPLASSINGLTPGTTYHYRIVAQSPAGTVDGADETFVAGGTSAVKVLGREGFVSPGDVIGIQMGCFGGVTTCSGTFTVTAGSTVVGQHTYTIAPNSGGFHNFKLTPAGANLLASNSVFHLLGVTVTVKDNSGQTLRFVVHLARWYWHS
jgi:hypothetical protein